MFPKIFLKKWMHTNPLNNNSFLVIFHNNSMKYISQYLRVHHAIIVQIFAAAFFQTYHLHVGTQSLLSYILCSAVMLRFHNFRLTCMGASLFLSNFFFLHLFCFTFSYFFVNKSLLRCVFYCLIKMWYNILCTVTQFACIFYMRLVTLNSFLSSFIHTDLMDSLIRLICIIYVWFCLFLRKKKLFVDLYGRSLQSHFTVDYK